MPTTSPSLVGGRERSGVGVVVGGPADALEREPRPQHSAAQAVGDLGRDADDLHAVVGGGHRTDGTVRPVSTHPPAVTVDAAPDDERRRAVLVAIAVAGEAARRGRSLSPDLRIWRLAAVPAPVGAAGAAGPPRPSSPSAGPDEDDPAGVLGAALEAATDGGLRRAQGLHVTPRWLADDLVARALPDAAADDGPRRSDGPTVCDPACGGGAFLVAGARRLHAGGLDRRTVVRHHAVGRRHRSGRPGRRRGGPGAVGGRGASARSTGRRRPAPRRDRRLARRRPTGSTRWSATRRSRASSAGPRPATTPTRAALRTRYGDAVRAYTDTAWLFLLLGLRADAPGRAGRPGPAAVGRRRPRCRGRCGRRSRRAADLRDLWLDDGRVFTRRGAGVRAGARAPARDRRRRHDADGADDAHHGGGAEPWARAWARAATLPPVDLRPARHGDAGGAGCRRRPASATSTTGWPRSPSNATTCRPARPSRRSSRAALVDWVGCGWGDPPGALRPAPLGGAGRRPRPPVGRPAGGAAAGSPGAAAPKLVVASQTRVVEAAVDPDGRLGALGAGAGGGAARSRATCGGWPRALLAPAASAWLAHRSGGTALDRAALKVAKPDLAALPLPGDPTAWDAAARALADYRARPGPAAARPATSRPPRRPTARRPR